MMDFLFVFGSIVALAWLIRRDPRWRRRASRKKRFEPLWLVGAHVVAALIVLPLVWEISGARGYQSFGTLVDRVESDRRVVALTFDDGPTPGGTDAILDVLDDTGTRATFFVTGGELAAHPELGRRLVAAGHELGNHTYSHRRMLLRSPGFIRAQVERTDTAIRSSGYEGPIHFRAPYGRKLLDLPYFLSRTGRTHVFWDVEPDSYPEVAASPRRITAHVLERVRPGSIILLHVMYASRATSLQAVPDIIDGLHDAGYELVTVSELLTLRGSDP